jgi:predicted nucleic acid-binding Zn ribbon protein
VEEASCPSCGGTVRTDSAFCHHCGAALETPNTRQGRVYVTATLVVAVVIPLVLMSLYALTSLQLIGEISPTVLVEIIPPLLVAPLYALVYRGYSWARVPIAAYLALHSLVRFLLVLVPSGISSAIPNFMWALILIGLSIMMIRSDRIKAFIRYRRQMRTA